MSEIFHKVSGKGSSIQDAFDKAAEALLESGIVKGDILPKPLKGATKKVEGFKKEKATYAKSENAQTYQKVFIVKNGDESLGEFNTITEAKKTAQTYVLENKSDVSILVEHRIVEGDAVYATVAYQPETMGEWELTIVEEIADEETEEETDADEATEETEVEATDEDADEASDEDEQRIAAE